jgi:hypothetical protein
LILTVKVKNYSTYSTSLLSFKAFLALSGNEADAEDVKVEMKRIMQKRFRNVFEGTLIEVEVNIVDDWSQKGAKKPETLALAA